MSVSDVRHTTSGTAVPRPRTPEQDDVAIAGPDGAPASSPWPEPWRSAPGTRPRSEYWDVTTASWRSGGPMPSRGC